MIPVKRMNDSPALSLGLADLALEHVFGLMTDVEDKEYTNTIHHLKAMCTCVRGRNAVYIQLSLPTT